jgi:hypothetical protein
VRVIGRTSVDVRGSDADALDAIAFALRTRTEATPRAAAPSAMTSADRAGRAETDRPRAGAVVASRAPEFDATVGRC